jgi:hypothetical protein
MYQDSEKRGQTESRVRVMYQLAGHKKINYTVDSLRGL